MTEREVFTAAVALTDPARREAFLREACVGQDQLRRRVDALLRAHDDASAFLGTPAIEQVIGTTSPDVSGTPPHAVNPADVTTHANSEIIADLHADRTLAYLSPTAKPGSLGRLGHYEIEAILGRGGFGTVLKAFDERLHRTVAIKMLAPELAATSPPRKRFLREARAAAAIRHQNVVAIHAVEDVPIPYFVMECVPGETLQQLLDGHGPLDVADVLSIGQQIASGLAAAHAQGLVHRDIKPSNILLEGGRTGIVRISDFGLARTADDASLTQSGTVAGTPLFMSPEQAMGRSIDQRSDLFSLGSVLYVMVTGRPPFRAPSTVAVLRRVVEDPPRPISEIIPECPAWLSAIIAKLLAKSPEDRIESAAEVAELLGHCLADLRANRPIRLPAGIPPVPQPIARPQPADSRRESTISSRRASRIAVGLLIAALALGVTEATGVTRLAQSVFRLTTGAGTRIRLEQSEVQAPAARNISSAADASERRVAEWALSKGAYLRLVAQTPAGTPLYFEPKSVAELPPREFVCETINFPFGTKFDGSELRQLLETRDLKKLDLFRSTLDDSGLAIVCGIQSLTYLNIGQTHVTDAGLPSLQRLRKLNGLDLFGLPVTAAALQALHGLPLEHFGVGATKLTGADWQVLASFPRLTMLSFQETPGFGDADLAQLVQLKQIEGLHLGQSSVSNAGLSHLQQLSNLNTLFIGYNRNLTDAAVEPLTQVTSLRELHAESTSLTADGIARLHAALPECRILWDGGVFEPAASNDKDRRAAEWALSAGSSIEVTVDGQRRPVRPGEPLPDGPLQLNWADVPSNLATPENLAHFAGCRHLTHLNLAGDQVVDAGVQSFQDSKQLVRLTLENTAVTDAGLAAFAGCRELETLILNNSPVTDAGLRAFDGCSKLHNLQLSQTGVTDAGLAYFENCPQLVELVLGYTDITDAGLAHFQNCPQLAHLNLIDTPVSDAGMEHFRDRHELSVLVLSNTRVSDAGLGCFENSPKLVRLQLDNLGVTDAGLANFRECTGLTDLTLFGAKITDAALEPLSRCRNLTYLLLDNTNVSDAGLVHLQECRQLQRLHLDNTQVGDAGLVHIVDCDLLQQVTLTGTRVGDASLSVFADCKGLMRLNLYGTRVTDAGLQQLASLASLTELDLRHTSVTADGVNALKSSFPKCRIDWDGGVVEPTP